jgi:hypothetical protein
MRIRNTVSSVPSTFLTFPRSMFLTRGDLWLSWEHGLEIFLRDQIDADWAVCAGNWMWVSSSAFEKSLNCRSADVHPCLVAPE